jgi:predicted O-methyltransferase YrrM
MRHELERLPQGWFHHGEKILDLMEQYRPAVTVELGTWKGASAIAMARLAKSWGGVIFCIDTWAGQVSGSRGGTVPVRPAMLAEGATNLMAAGVAPAVRLIPSRTDAAAALWNLPIDFLYVDADHTKPSVRTDLDLWWPHLKTGGLVAGDDYDSPLYPGVREAWDEFEYDNGQHFDRFATPNTNPPGMRLVYGLKEVWL